MKRLPRPLAKSRSRCSYRRRALFLLSDRVGRSAYGPWQFTRPFLQDGRRRRFGNLLSVRFGEPRPMLGNRGERPVSARCTAFERYLRPGLPKGRCRFPASSSPLVRLPTWRSFFDFPVQSGKRTQPRKVPYRPLRSTSQPSVHSGHGSWTAPHSPQIFSPSGSW